MYVFAINNEVKAYPYSISDMKKDNPQVSFPSQISTSLLAEFNVYIVVSVGIPEYDHITQRLVEVNPIWSGTRWERSYVIRPKEQHNASSI
jgi:hypothetical protein